MTTAARWALRTITLLMLLATAAMLFGCGGGDLEDEPIADQPTLGLNCNARHEVCK